MIKMADLILREVPEQLYRRLQRRAAQNQRGIDTEAVACIEHALVNHEKNPVAVLQRARELRSKITGHLTDDELLALKNQGRP